MFGWLTSLFSTKSTDQIVETGSHLLEEAASGIDVLFYTDEEKAQAKEKAFKHWLKLQTLPESPVRGITRRLIAVPWMFLQMGLVIAALAGYFFDQKFSILCVDIMREFVWITGTIVVFYFGPYMAEQIIRKVKK